MKTAVLYDPLYSLKKVNNTWYIFSVKFDYLFSVNSCISVTLILALIIPLYVSYFKQPILLIVLSLSNLNLIITYFNLPLLLYNHHLPLHLACFICFDCFHHCSIINTVSTVYTTMFCVF